LLIKYTKSVRWRVAKRLSYIEDARCLKVKSAVASVQSTTGSRGVRISGSNAGYTMYRGSVKSTGYPLHSPVSPSLPLPCVAVCHHVSTGLYFQMSGSGKGKLASMNKPSAEHLLSTVLIYTLFGRSWVQISTRITVILTEGTIVFLSTSNTITAAFHIPSNLLYTDHSTIRCGVV